MLMGSANLFDDQFEGARFLSPRRSSRHQRTTLTLWDFIIVLGCRVPGGCPPRIRTANIQIGRVVCPKTFDHKKSVYKNFVAPGCRCYFGPLSVESLLLLPTLPLHVCRACGQLLWAVRRTPIQLFVAARWRLETRTGCTCSQGQGGSCCLSCCAVLSRGTWARCNQYKQKKYIHLLLCRCFSCWTRLLCFTLKTHTIKARCVLYIIGDFFLCRYFPLETPIACT